MKKLSVIVLSLISFSLILFFQNCSDVPLMQQVKTVVASSKMNFCLDSFYPNYTVDSFYTVNLNVVNRKNSVFIDSNSSGLSDIEKLQYGFDSKDRHSKGLLDVICYNLSGSSDCQQYLPLNCSNTVVNPFGLTECDVKSLQLASANQSEFGVDSDGDGIPDLIELLKGTNPAIVDALSDPDNDGVLNYQEIAHNTNPVYVEAGYPSQYLIQSEVKKVSAAVGSSCQENWQMNISQMPLFQTQAYQAPVGFVPSASQMNFYHDKNQNIVLVTLRLKPNPGPNVGAPYIFLYSYYKLDFGTSQFSMIFATDFKEAGTVAQ